MLSLKSIYKMIKEHNFIKKMQRLNINILGVSKTTWPNSGKSISHTKIATPEIATRSTTRTE